MKKIYLLAITLCLALGINAQIIDDNLESYSLGPIGAQNTSVWSVWSGTPSSPSDEDLIISNDVAIDGQSGFVGAGAGPQDVMLLLGNQTSGTYTLRFEMFIPFSRTGYFNFQGETENGGAGNSGMGVFNSPNIVFNNTQSVSGAPGSAGFYPNIDDDDPTVSWNYPENDWFTVSIFFDVDALSYTLTVDGTEIAPQPFDADTTVGAIDFFALDANNEYYIDNILFVDGVLGTDDFSADVFSVFPNPVQDVLNIRSAATIDVVTIYDVLGKLVLETTPDSISPRIDMSGLNSGAYLVQVTIDGATKTVKVIK